MRRAPLALALLTGAVLSLTGCSGGTAPSTSASPQPSDGASSAPAPSASGSGSPALETLSPDLCLSGSWRVVRFVAAGSQTYGTGEGGDLSVRFDGKGYTLSGAGKKPVTLTLGGNTGKLTVDGRLDGTYTLKDSTATFTPGASSGSGTVALGGASRQLTMDEVTNVIGLSGDGQVACTVEAMTITLPTVRLELGRE